ncbi:hypothetical protein HMPREF9102_1469 [Limosilactobacillus oris F0423]|uniref:Uncharacterized protein n=2 Tax=Limosilactobacillus oris TaxID=1632 RepID=A0ABN0D5J8_9LACO|nr:hypothetical protein HMPREF9102_1469 [Limosilactobacillus oris F0423]
MDSDFMVKYLPFHGKRIHVDKLAKHSGLSAKEILFRYQHGCREDLLVVKNINKESLYSFVTYQKKRLTIKELLAKHQQPGLNEFVIRRRADKGVNLIKPLTRDEWKIFHPRHQ